MFGGVLCIYLFIPPQIGLADSADFGRITARLGISAVVESPSDQFFDFFTPKYRIVDTPKVPINMGQVFGLISLGLNNIFHTGTYSIFYLSFIFFLLYVGGFYLFLKNSFKYFGRATKKKILFGGLSLLVLSDIMFVSYFNSFYQEAVFLISALYVVGLLLAPKINYNWILLFFIILSLSKSQNILFLIFPLWIMIWKYKNLDILVLSLSILILSFFLFFIIKEQAKTNEPNLYEAVFLGLMTAASDEEQKRMLEDLELKEQGYLINVNKGYWRPNNELVENRKLSAEFYSKISQGKVIKTYIKNPGVFFKTIISGLGVLIKNSAQPSHLGNYSKKFSSDKERTVVQSIWGSFLNLLFLPVYLAGFIITASIVLKRWKEKISLCRLELFLLILTLWIPILYTGIFVAGGINDFVKHNLPVFYLISVMFLILLIFTLNTADKSLIPVKSSKIES